jgi:poly(beta-D-mannuronate) lyase
LSPRAALRYRRRNTFSQARRKLLRKLVSSLVVLSLTAASAFAASTRVTSISALQSAINSANPGDILTLANGSYSGSLSINRAGTASAPITITPDTIGGATLSGTGSISFGANASYVTLRGFRLTFSGAVTTAVGSDHCRISRNHFQRSGGSQHVFLYGFDHEVDYNRFQDRVNSPTVTIDKNLSSSWPTHNNTSRIYLHHNHFLRSSNSASNGGESIQTWGGFTRAEFNLFEETNGDPEVISSKASDCIYRYNTFRTITRGQLTLRYARRCTVEGNFFFNTPGTRVYGDNHKIRNNYHENAPLNLGDGKSGYLPIQNTEISFNTLVNSAVTRSTGDTPPTSTRFANNIIQNSSGSAVTHAGSITFEGNILWGAASAGTIPSSGYRRVDPQLVRNSNGVYHLGSSSPAIDSAAGSYSLPDDQDGQPRSAVKDVGADEVSSATVTRHAMTSADVGPGAGSTPPPPTPTPTPTSPGPTPTPTATPTPPSGSIKLPVPGSAVTASTHDGNVPANTVDSNLSTRWSANGDGQFITYDLGATKTVESVRLAWYQGNTRRSTFDVLVSDAAGGPFTALATGLQSSGTTTALQTHDIADRSARYVRIVGHGNTGSFPTWNSITETEIWGQ